MAIVIASRGREMLHLSRSRLRSSNAWRSPVMGELERDRLSAIMVQAERAGIKGSIPEMLHDPRLVNIVAGHFRVPAPNPDACLRYFRDHEEEFREPDRYVGRQIVLPIDDDAHTQGEAWARAERIIAILNFTPRMFPDLLLSYGSKSGAASGQIGPVAPGALPPQLEAIFFALHPGEICPVPVITEAGVHVVLMDRILPGEVPPLSSVAGRVSFLLRQELRHNAAARHLARLAERFRAATGGLDGRLSRG